MIGQTIDQYRIEARLGGGGMGEVFRARDLELDRDVAIKLVRPELSDLDEVTARFRAEARTLAQLSHTNIATVYRFFAHEGTLYLVMEYISGQPFGDMLRDKGARPAGEVVGMVKQALSGLGYAHENKVVHRDIKPGNLMLDGRDTVKVLDFGIAHLLDQTRITQSGSVLGTPAYMAPEQVLGQAVDGRTDLYALGVVLFEMLTGKLPFRANSQFELMRAHLETQPRSLKEMSDTVPRPLQETVIRALAKESSDRYQSASEFSEALDGAIAAAEAEGLDLSTVAAPARSPVKVVSANQNTPRDVPRDTPGTVARTRSDQTDVRMPTSVEIPLPEPRTAVGAAVAGVLLIGAGIWWFSGSDSQSPTVIANTSNSSAIQTQVAAPVGNDGWTDDGVASEEVADNVVTLSEEGVADRSKRDASTLASLPATSTGERAQSATTEVAAVGNTGSSTAAAPAAPVAPRTTATRPTASSTKTAPSPKPSTTTRSTSTPRSSATTQSASLSYRVRATKVSAHERQGLSRLSRSAGYNGSFSLSVPRGGVPIQIDELVEVYQGGRQVSRQLIHSEIRKGGRFKSKQRIPGLKELMPGAYQMRLVFENEGSRLGFYEWDLVVGSG